MKNNLYTINDIASKLRYDDVLSVANAIYLIVQLQQHIGVVEVIGVMMKGSNVRRFPGCLTALFYKTALSPCNFTALFYNTALSPCSTLHCSKTLHCRHVAHCIVLQHCTVAM